MNSRSKLFLPGLLAWYVLFSLSMAIAPVSRQFWIAANILPVVFVTALALTHRLFPLSRGSYVLITIFLTLHTVGVHYTYSQVPVGGWLQQSLHLSRNHFDRVVHFSFGFLLTYPLEEMFRMFACLRGWLLYYLPVITILGLSGLWEIIESWVARAVRPDLGLTVLGSQGDVWDAQKDMTAALYGSILCLVLIFLLRIRSDRSSTVTELPESIEELA
ncbi:MAG: DUF2238 domain-containing protein [Nitrospiraceae bacterium]